MSAQIEKNNPGYDTGEPANKRIAFVLILSAAILIALVPVFNSYFNFMMEREIRSEEKWGKAGVELRSEIEAAQRERLEKAPMSVDAAKRKLSEGSRDAVQPKSSDDLGPLVGWGLNPNEAAAEAAQAARERAAAASAAASGEGEDGASEDESTDAEAADAE